MPLSNTVEALQQGVQKAIKASRDAVVFLARKTGEALQPVIRQAAILAIKITQSGLMKKVGKAAVSTFNATVVPLGKGFGNGLIEFGALGFSPVDNFKDFKEHYKKNVSANPFYLVGSAAGAVIATPIAAASRVAVDLGTGVALGFVEAFSKGRSIKADMKSLVDDGRYLALPTFALSYAIFKPMEFTAKHLRDGVVRGWNVDFKGFIADIQKEPNYLQRLPLALVNTTGLAIGLSARAVKYPVQHTVKGFVEGAAVMVNYHRFRQEEFFAKTLYKESNQNILHNAAMVPGVVVGLVLGQGGSMIGGMIFGFGSGVIAGANLPKYYKVPFEVLNDLSGHQKLVMVPALVTHAAGSVTGLALSLATWPIHSKDNFKKTFTTLLMPVGAVYLGGETIYNKMKNKSQANASAVVDSAVVPTNILPVISPVTPGPIVSLSPEYSGSPVTLYAVGSEIGSNDTELSATTPYLSARSDVDSPSNRRVYT